MIRLFIKFFHADILNTLRVNAKLPWRQAIKLPIWVYGCTIDSLKGRISIDYDKIQTGMIRMGLKTSGMCGRNNSLNLCLNGEILFKGPGYMGNNSAIEIGVNGILEMGKNFGITGNFKIACRKHIIIGENFSSSWGVGIYDTDFHNVIDIHTGKRRNPDSEIVIGKDCWICQNSTVLKGSVLPDRSILAASSLLNKDYHSTDTNTLYAGVPAKPVTTGLTREEFLHFENSPIANIVNYLGL